MKFLFAVSIVAMLCLTTLPAQAFWGNEAGRHASGLDVAGGFDVNTMSTLNATVTTEPQRLEPGQHTVMTVTTPSGTVTVVLGPWWYWEKQGFAVAKGNDIVISGSRAQGKDGSSYLFVQKIDNKANGQSLVLRSESGKPLWSHGKPGEMRGKNGTGMRGGGRGMHGGRP